MRHTTGKEKFAFLFSPRMVVADILGCALIGLGLAKLIEGVDIIPADWRFAGYEWAFFITGIIILTLTLRLFLQNIKQARDRNDRGVQ